MYGLDAKTIAEKAKAAIAGTDWKLWEQDLNPKADDMFDDGVYLIYKTSTNVEDAITDLRVMSMYGGYSTSGVVVEKGANVIYSDIADIHVSGHPCQEELKLMLNLVKPQYFIPVHGEYKHLRKHAMLAESAGIPKENVILANTGEVLRINKDGITVEESVTSGQVLVDGYGVGDVGSVVLRDRRHLSQDGIVVVVFTIDGYSDQLLSGPDIISRGFVYVKESEALISEARLAARQVIEKYEHYDYKDWTVIKSKIRDQVSNVLYKKTKRSPMVLPIVMEV